MSHARTHEVGAAAWSVGSPAKDVGAAASAKSAKLRRALEAYRSTMNGKARWGEDRDDAQPRRRGRQLPRNPWGLYDLHGNVYEWCSDWYHARLPGGADPDLASARSALNPDGTYSRVRRGGAWVDDGQPCRCALRLRFEPERRSDHIGLRVVAVHQ